jgi:hypothetical protein
MAFFRGIGRLLIICYICAESLLVKDNTMALRSAEEGIDRATHGKLAEKHPETYIGLLSTLSLIGIFAPVAIYLKKYYILLTIYVLLTRWQVFFSTKGPFHDEFYNSRLPGNRFEGNEGLDGESFRAYTTSFILYTVYTSMPPPYVVTTFCLAMVFFKESIDSIYKPQHRQQARQFSMAKLRELIYEEIIQHQSSLESTN